MAIPNQEVIQYMIENRDDIIRINKLYTDQYNEFMKYESSILRPVIENQYIDIVKFNTYQYLSKLLKDITKEETLATIQLMDMKHYLEVDIIETSIL